LILCNISSSFTRSSQLILSILLQHHISKLSRRFCIYNKIVYLSGQHVSTLQGRHQALQEDRSKSCVTFHCIVGCHNALKHNTALGSVFLEGLRMTYWVETYRPDIYTIVYKNKCCVID
jgi:hypothetical protein